MSKALKSLHEDSRSRTGRTKFLKRTDSDGYTILSQDGHILGQYSNIIMQLLQKAAHGLW